MARQPVTDRDWDDAHLINAAIDIHHDDPGFGYRFIADELHRQGSRPARTGWRGCVRRSGSGRRSRRNVAWPASRARPVHDDLVERDFTAVSLDELWFTDITEHPTGEGKLYLCAIKDACSTRIVGYAMADRMTAAARGDRVAVRHRAARTVGTLMIHSDRGRQFRSHAYVRTLRDHKLSRVDGPSRRVRRQRRDGIVLLAAAEERPRPATLGHPRRAPAHDHHLDRTDLPPPAPPTRSRSTHTHRV